MICPVLTYGVRAALAGCKESLHPAGVHLLNVMFPGLRPLRGLNPGLRFLHRSAVL
jgi:hypothetical protein